MKKNSLLVLVSLFSNLAFADCDFSKDIKPQPDGTYNYSAGCHLKVGQLVQDNQVMTTQLTDLNKAIKLKDLALSKSDDRTQLWMTTVGDMQDRLTKIDETYRHNEFLYFGLGILATVATGFAVARLTR